MPPAVARLSPGDRAPTPDVLGPDGPVSLASVWADGPVLLTFLRHFG
jgi:hypothetical protein